MFSDCLLKEAHFHDNTSVLKMLKIWDPEDHNAFVADNQRFALEGLIKYWLSVDSVIHYWNTAIYPKICKMASGKRQMKIIDKYHWQK